MADFAPLAVEHRISNQPSKSKEKGCNWKATSFLVASVALAVILIYVVFFSPGDAKARDFSMSLVQQLNDKEDDFITSPRAVRFGLRFAMMGADVESANHHRMKSVLGEQETKQCLVGGGSTCEPSAGKGAISLFVDGGPGKDFKELLQNAVGTDFSFEADETQGARTVEKINSWAAKKFPKDKEFKSIMDEDASSISEIAVITALKYSLNLPGWWKSSKDSFAGSSDKVTFLGGKVKAKVLTSPELQAKVVRFPVGDELYATVVVPDEGKDVKGILRTLTRQDNFAKSDCNMDGYSAAEIFKAESKSYEDAIVDFSMPKLTWFSVESLEKKLAKIDGLHGAFSEKANNLFDEMGDDGDANTDLYISLFKHAAKLSTVTGPDKKSEPEGDATVTVKATAPFVLAITVANGKQSRGEPGCDKYHDIVLMAKVTKPTALQPDQSA